MRRLTETERAAIWGSHHILNLPELFTATDYRIESLRTSWRSSGDIDSRSAVDNRKVEVTWWDATTLRTDAPCGKHCYTSPTTRGCIVMCNPSAPDGRGHFLRFVERELIHTASITLNRLASWARSMSPETVERVRGGLTMDQEYWLLVDLLGPCPRFLPTWARELIEPTPVIDNQYALF